MGKYHGTDDIVALDFVLVSKIDIDCFVVQQKQHHLIKTFVLNDRFVAITPIGHANIQMSFFFHLQCYDWLHVLRCATSHEQIQGELKCLICQFMMTSGYKHSFCIMFEENNKLFICVNRWAKYEAILQSSISEYFSVLLYVLDILQEVSGWFYLLNDELGRRKHLRVVTSGNPVAPSMTSCSSAAPSAVDDAVSVISSIAPSDHTYHGSYPCEMPFQGHYSDRLQGKH